MKTFLLLVLFFLSTIVNGQSNTPCGIPLPPLLVAGTNCVNTNGTTVGATYSSNAANAGTPPCASPGAPDVWYSFIAPPGGAVNIQTSAGSINDGGMALYSGGCPNNFNLIQCDDDSGPGLMPQINATGLTPGNVYYIRFWKFGGAGNGNGNNATGTFSICLTFPSPLASNVTCSNPSPICSGTPINFTANTGATPASQSNPGNNYGCLQTTPNPSWYYLEIATGGNLVIDVSAGSDVDFAIWGPYTNLTQATANCNNYGVPQDCSYSTSAVEQVNLTNVATSEVYILLVTNYANTIQNINVNNNGGTATTNCGILILPVELSSWKVTTTTSENRLTWTTQSERNSSYFAVQRASEDGLWETISVTSGAGNSNEELSYEFVDKKPLSGTNYYRLLQVDTDGTSVYSDVISANGEQAREMSLYPNPAKEKVRISGVSETDVEELIIRNVNGNVLELSRTAVGNDLELNINDLQDGVYFVQCTFKDGSTSFARFVVQ